MARLIPAPARVDLPAVTQGDSWQGLTVGPVTFDGEAWPVALETVRMKVRVRQTGTAQGALVLSFHSSPTGTQLPVTITDAATWEFEIPEVPYDDLPIEAGVYEYQIECTDEDGFRLTLYEGSWTVGRDITDPD